MNKTLWSNIASLSILNALNLLLPLVSIPYLIAKVGSANYGAYAITYTILQYALLIGTYGFNCIATRQIVQCRDNITEISIVFWSTIFARILLSLAAAVLLLFLVLFAFPRYIVMYLFGLGIVFGDILNPVWLFQGMEKMKYMTIVNAISKIVFTLSIFIFIRKETDYVYISLLNSAGFIVSGVISFCLAVKMFHLKFMRFTIRGTISQIKDAGVVFGSTAFISLYNNSFVFILGLFLSEASIGIYAAVEKIIRAAKSVVEPISVALFPHIAQLFLGHQIKDNISLLFNYAKKIAIPLMLLSLALVFLSPVVCNLFLKSIAVESIVLIRLMSPLVFFGGLNYLLGVVGMINLGLQKEWLKVLIISSTSAILVLLLSVRQLDYFAAVVASMVAEVLICILCLHSFIGLRK